MEVNKTSVAQLYVGEQRQLVIYSRTAFQLTNHSCISMSGLGTKFMAHQDEAFSIR